MIAPQDPDHLRENLLLTAIKKIKNYKRIAPENIYRELTNNPEFTDLHTQWQATFINGAENNHATNGNHAITLEDVRVASSIAKLERLKIGRPRVNPIKIRKGPPSLEDTPEELYRKKLMQDAAIQTASTNFAVMKNYDVEQAREIANKLFNALLEFAPAAIANASNKPVTLEKIAENEAGETGIGKNTFLRCLKDHVAPEPSHLAAGGAVDRLMEQLCINPASRDKAANFLMGIPWPERHISGDALMEYAAKHHMNCGDVMRIKQFESRITQREHAAKLGINSNSYNSMVYKNGAKPSKAIIDTTARKLGCTSTIRVFRQLALGIDPIEALKDLRSMVIPTAASSGEERAVQIARFVQAFRDAVGVRDNKELAEYIAGKLQVNASELQDTLNAMSADLSKEEPTPRRYLRSMDPKLAAAMASVAYPMEPSKREACARFLTHTPKWTERALQVESRSR